MKRVAIWMIGLLALCVLEGGTGQAAAGYVPPVYPGTGPYQRVYSDSDSGYSYMSATVYLPGSSQIYIAGSTPSNPNGNGDTPYVYAGGWGLNGAGAVDAGFQYSPTYNDWSLFAKGAGNGLLAYGNRNTRFAADQPLFLSFAVVQVGSSVDLVVTAMGIEVNTNTQVTESLTLPNAGGTEGWAVGGQNTFKRMTSIGQNGDNFTDGSYIDGVVWSNAMLGQDASDAVAWSGGGSQSYPGTPGVVNVNYVDPADETDSIILAVPAPRSWVMLAIGQVFGLNYCWRRRRRGATA